MARTLLRAQVRTEHGTRNVKRLRRRGIVPGVLYGDVKENISIGVDTKDLQKILRGKGGDSAIFDLQVEGEGMETPLKKTVIVKEVQRDHIKDAVIHVDFAAISMTEKLVAHVAVVRSGEPAGGGDEVPATRRGLARRADTLAARAKAQDRVPALTAETGEEGDAAAHNAAVGAALSERMWVSWAISVMRSSTR